jgi:hypothetical protein
MTLSPSKFVFKLLEISTYKECASDLPCHKTGNRAMHLVLMDEMHVAGGLCVNELVSNKITK